MHIDLDLSLPRPYTASHIEMFIIDVAHLHIFSQVFGGRTTKIDDQTGGDQAGNAEFARS